MFPQAIAIHLVGGTTIYHTLESREAVDCFLEKLRLGGQMFSIPVTGMGSVEGAVDWFRGSQIEYIRVTPVPLAQYAMTS